MDAVLFDLFGTLVPNLPPERWRLAYFEIAGVLEVDPERFHREWNSLFEQRMVGTYQSVEDQMRGALGKFGANASDAALSRAAMMKRTFLLEALKPKDDALHCLEALRARGFKLALVTDCSWETPEILNDTPLGV